MAEVPATKYGNWTRGNMGRVGRCVTSYTESLMVPGTFIPIITWEEHPDEIGLSESTGPRWEIDAMTGEARQID